MHSVGELKQALDALLIAIEQYKQPSEAEVEALRAAIEVQDAMNTLLETNAVVCDGLIRLGSGKTGALLRINGGMQVLSKLMGGPDGTVETIADIA